MSIFANASKITLAALLAPTLWLSEASADGNTPDASALIQVDAVEGQPLPDYPRRAELSGIEGYTVVDYVVLPDGRVADAQIRQSSNRLFTRAALNTVKSWEFEPRVDVPNAQPETRTIKFNFTGL